jgi:hypothetical protein
MVDGGQAQRDQTCNDQLLKHVSVYPFSEFEKLGTIGWQPNRRSEFGLARITAAMAARQNPMCWAPKRVSIAGGHPSGTVHPA